MHMVRLNVEFYNLAAQLLAEHHHTFVDFLANRTLQQTNRYFGTRTMWY